MTGQPTVAERANHTAPSSDVVLEVTHLAKTFRTAWRRRPIHAVVDVSFQVCRGEVFGFLGPNGAGKTTTIKMCMGLVRPTGGTIRIFGLHHDAIEVRRRVGFLPEHPYFYDYLRPAEILTFYGRLFGIPSRLLRQRVDELLERVGLAHARDRTLRKFSKGMLQRIGIAQALVNDPEFIVLDEPLSGLDPIGRKQVRDLLVELRAAGKTIFFSSHILADIEMICDKVAIIHEGRIRSVGALDALLHPDRLQVEVTFRSTDPALLNAVEQVAAGVDRLGDYARAVVEGSPDPVLRILVERGVPVESVVPRRETLEDLFVRQAIRNEAVDASDDARAGRARQRAG